MRSWAGASCAVETAYLPVSFPALKLLETPLEISSYTTVWAALRSPWTPAEVLGTTHLPCTCVPPQVKSHFVRFHLNVAVTLLRGYRYTATAVPTSFHSCTVSFLQIFFCSFLLISRTTFYLHKFSAVRTHFCAWEDLNRVQGTVARNIVAGTKVECCCCLPLLLLGACSRLRCRCHCCRAASSGLIAPVWVPVATLGLAILHMGSYCLRSRISFGIRVESPSPAPPRRLDGTSLCDHVHLWTGINACFCITHHSRFHALASCTRACLRILDLPPRTCA